MQKTYWQIVWGEFKSHRTGILALWVVGIFFFLGLYAPFFASSQPLFLVYDGEVYFPLFHYLFYTGFYTKPVDIFFNVLMFVLPLCGFFYYFWPKKVAQVLLVGSLCQVLLFSFFFFRHPVDPAGDATLVLAKKEILEEKKREAGSDHLLNKTWRSTWAFDQNYRSSFSKVELLLQRLNRMNQHERLSQHAEDPRSRWAVEKANIALELEQKRETLAYLEADYLKAKEAIPGLQEAYFPLGSSLDEAQKQVQLCANLLLQEKAELRKVSMGREGGTSPNLSRAKEDYHDAKARLSQIRTRIREECGELTAMAGVINQYEAAQHDIQYLEDREAWYEEALRKISFVLWPLIRSHHWEDDVGGEQSLNRQIPWWELSRSNRKDMVSALIFGIRVSLVVGFSAVALSLLIGIPVGSMAGYYGGKTDITVSRVMEIWEAMPTLFMLLTVVAITQSKSIFLVISVLGIFGWTGFSRYIRGEIFKQRTLPYVEACKAMGFPNWRIIFGHILPNAIPPVLTLLPFSIMAAITSEAGLSFLGLGEEGSSSWGVLMDEGRAVFPGESYLLWPPAIMLTVLLVAVALVGDALRDALDPKLRKA